MATRGQIAYLANPNTIRTIYIHYDAYPEHLGKILPEYFNSDEEAEDLVTGGQSIRFIDDDGMVDRFDEGNADIIKGETPEDLFNSLYDHSDGAAANYVYIWLEDKWISLNMNKGREYFVGTLLDSIRKMEQTMNESYTDATNNELASYIGVLQNEIGAEKNPKKLAMLKQDLEDVKSELAKRKSTKVNSHYVSNEEADEDARLAKMKEIELNESFIHQMKYRAGIIK
jgi:hypothetical protein